jgi:hypothetical protein
MKDRSEEFYSQMQIPKNLEQRNNFSCFPLLAHLDPQPKQNRLLVANLVKNEPQMSIDLKALTFVCWIEHSNIQKLFEMELKKTSQKSLTFLAKLDRG